jgi:myo-inositol-1(or 4)-monophosphatase
VNEQADPQSTASTLRELAVELATVGGTVAAEGWRQDIANGASRRSMTAATKSSLTDVVTSHDRAAEAAIVEALVARRPDDAIVGEEGTQRTGTSGLSWFLDPIDGTTNFLYGLPLWSTSVGVADGDGTVAGAVFVPGTGELFAAARGAGATRNGEPIRASAEADVSLALVATGFGYLAERRAAQARRLTALIDQIRDIRRGGSAALDLCYAAAGIVDAYYEDGLNSWDVAAGELIAREAGCRTGDFAGGPPTPAQLLVAPPALFERLSALLVSAG